MAVMSGDLIMTSPRSQWGVLPKSMGYPLLCYYTPFDVLISNQIKVQFDLESLLAGKSEFGGNP